MKTVTSQGYYDIICSITNKILIMLSTCEINMVFFNILIVLLNVILHV